jgi:hypothetical protein
MLPIKANPSSIRQERVVIKALHLSISSLIESQRVITLREAILSKEEENLKSSTRIKTLSSKR